MDKMREEFERWYKSKFPLRVNGLDKWGDIPPYSEEYQNKNTTSLFEVWQASRKSLVVTLPEVSAFNLCDLLDKKEVIEHIRAAGITVKGEGYEQTNVLPD